jgi:plastocyanin domain-containing protein
VNHRSSLAVPARSVLAQLSTLICTLSLATLALVSSFACAKTEAGAPGKVSVTADGEGFHPSSVEVKQGSPLTLEFKRTSDKTCATEVVFPDLKIEKKLPLNEVVSIEIPTTESRTLTFQCGMAMYKSKIVVR